MGNAVARNRARRRLRAALAEHAAALQPGRAYLLGTSREALTVPFPELVRCLGAALADRDGPA